MIAPQIKPGFVFVLLLPFCILLSLNQKKVTTAERNPSPYLDFPIYKQAGDSIYTTETQGCAYIYPFYKCHPVIAAQKMLGILRILVNASLC